MNLEQSRRKDAFQLGTDLLPGSGGIYQAAIDFRAAIGGSICSVVEPDLEDAKKDGEISYYASASDPVRRRLSWLQSDEKIRLHDRLLEDASHLILHGCFRMTAKYALDFSLKSKRPLIFVPHGGLDPWVFSYRGLQKRLWMKSIGKRLLVQSDAVLAMTRNELKKIQRFVGERPNQHVIHLPLPLDIFDAPSDRNSIRQRWNIPSDARVLCYLGRLHTMKRPMETIDAIARRRGELHLVFAGPSDGVDIGDLKAYAERCGVKSRVHVLGPVYGQDKYDLLRACDAYISLSHRENFNYTAAEAMSVGLPVILSPGNDLQGELMNSNCGWMLESLDMEHVDACLKCVEDISDSKLQEMGGLGREWVRENLSVDRFRDSLSRLLSSF